MASKNTLFRCCTCGRTYWHKEKTGELSVKKAAFGAIIAGPAGAVVGAAMGKERVNNSCPYCGSTMRTFA